MKNKLFIIVACFSLMAVCGTAGADELPTLDIGDPAESEVQTLDTADTLTSRGTLISNFAADTLLLGQRLDTCGNNVVDQGEECEFITKEDGTVVEVVAGVQTLVANFAPSTCPEDTSCNRDTCRCEMVPICGDGRVAHTSGEQCESFDRDGNAATPDYMTMLCQRSRTAGADIAVSTAYACVDCMCELCGNGVKDPGEDCDGTAGCNSECKMALEPEPQIKCTMIERGALSSDYINELNSQARAIMSGAAGRDVNVDIFGEAVYSEMLIQAEFPNASFKGEISDPNVLLKVAKSGETYITGSGFYQLGGPIYDNLANVVRMDRQSLGKAVHLFPRADAGTVSKGTKSQIGGSEVFIPDVSASLPGVEILGDLISAGFKDTQLTIVDSNQGSLNGVLRFMVTAQPPTAVTKAEGQAVPQLGSTIAILDAKTWFAPGGWADPSGDLIHHDPNEVLAALQEVVNQLKAEGRQNEIDCGIMNLVLEQMKAKGQKYEAQMVSKFAIVSGSLKLDSATSNVVLSDQQVVRPVFAAVHTEFGAGGAGTGPMSCSLATAQAHAPQILITLGMMVASIAGVGIIRRRKR